ncbi:MAG: class I SAM-dependent methyltransferase [Candidatus Binatia bacterium]|nr:class I SAM-dependent methyltransferase [Candidatus Binatia bacterium]MDG1958638.1 class I SAM-dependent methyltransferase [Candidatus Binatia bacterium]MDG2009053.1 class I SAM-dependent methyltransferase [Candidatus Binatia bacterium]
MSSSTEHEGSGPRPCLICGARGAKPLHGPRSSLYRCSCGQVFVDPIPSGDEIAQREDDAFAGGLMDETAEMFTAYYRDFPEDPVVLGFRATLERLHQLTGGGRLVDVGIGTGLLLHLGKEAGFDVLGCEISPGAAAKATEEFGVEVQVGDFLEAEFSVAPSVITMADVLEHTHDPRIFLEHALGTLKPGGALFVAVPNHRSTLFGMADILARLPVVGSLAERLYVPNHYWYFTPATLRRLAEDVGFEVSEVRGDTPYLGRYSFSFPIRAGLAVLFAIGKWTGLEGRVEIYARKPA